jgi:hypothetical protein
MAPPAGVRAALALAVISAAIAAGFVWSCSSQSSGSGTAAACSRARIGGRTVCLKPRMRCEQRYERIYRSYGLTCHAGPDGYRLRQRTYIGPPNP